MLRLRRQWGKELELRARDGWRRVWVLELEGRRFLRSGWVGAEEDSMMLLKVV